MKPPGIAVQRRNVAETGRSLGRASVVDFARESKIRRMSRRALRGKMRLDVRFRHTRSRGLIRLPYVLRRLKQPAIHLLRGSIKRCVASCVTVRRALHRPAV